MQHRYGPWQDLGCLSIKEGLLRVATPGSGRVPLRTFYTAKFPGNWEPTESREYLKEIGALDESDPSGPSVVIPNYFDSPSNCMNVSSYFHVCCISECEALLSSLERKLSAPKATPQHII